MANQSTSTPKGQPPAPGVIALPDLLATVEQIQRAEPPEVIAGRYAVAMARHYGHRADEFVLECYLDELRAGGASFDDGRAMLSAMRLSLSGENKPGAL